MTKVFTESAKVMSKGQITIPKDVCQILGVNTGDGITFIVEGDSVRIIVNGKIKYTVFRQ